jgi:hypothetical protein
MPEVEEIGVAVGKSGVSAKASAIRAPDVTYPAATIPTVYADHVLNVAPSTEIIKFYLARIDPNVKDDSEYRMEPCAQVVMPVSGFLKTVLFFERTVEGLIASGVVDRKTVEDLRMAGP